MLGLALGLGLATTNLTCRRGDQPGPSSAPAAGRAAERVRGLVEDADGVRLAGALILLLPADAPDDARPAGSAVPVAAGESLAPSVAPFEARSDAEGRFVIHGVRPGTWRLLVEAPGFGALDLDRVQVPSPPLVLRLEGKSRTLVGTVSDAAGTPRAGASVRLESPSLRAPRVALTDAGGAFAFPGVGEGAFVLIAWDARTAAPPERVLVGTSDDPPPVRLRLGPAGHVRGRVHLTDGAPVAGAELRAIALSSDDPPATSRTGADGRFVLGPLPPDRYRIAVERAGFSARSAIEVAVRPDDAVAADFEMVRAARVAGRVTDAAGRPVAGAHVTLTGRELGADELIVLAGGLPLAAEAARLPLAAVTREGASRGDITDDQGRFVLEGVFPGRAHVEIQHSLVGFTRRIDLVLAPGEERELGDLDLPGRPDLAGAGR